MMETRSRTQPKAAPPSFFTPVVGGVLQRKCACGGSAGVIGECEGCNNKKLSLQRSNRNSEDETQNSEGVAPIVYEALRSPGKPLDAETRAFMEPRFGHDFGRVRVHADSQAAESARAVNALAYTVGPAVVFAKGQYAPQTSPGKRLLAHELAHTVQQGNSPRVHDKLDVTMPNDLSEREADAIAEAVMHGQPAPTAQEWNTQLARATPDTEDTLGQTPVTAPTETPTSTDEVAMGGDAGVPACPVKTTGTLSEVSWGETSGLYPSDQNKYQPDKWDQAKTCELLKMRGAVHAVGQRGQSVHKAKPKEGDAIEQKLKVYHLNENFPALDSEIADTEVKWFYLSSEADKPEVHPGTTGTTRVKGYGSFYNIGGGDVKKGDVWVHFYKLKPKAP